MSDNAAHIAATLGHLLNREVRQRIYAHLTANLGETVSQATYPLLSALERFGPMTAAELGAAIGLDRSVVSRHANALQQAGLIERSPDPRDRRWRQLALTQTGSDTVAVMRQRLVARIDTFLSTLPPGQADQFCAVFDNFVHRGLFPH